jgi:hypothetical protein
MVELDMQVFAQRSHIKTRPTWVGFKTAEDGRAEIL